MNYLIGIFLFITLVSNNLIIINTYDNFTKTQASRGLKVLFGISTFIVLVVTNFVIISILNTL